MSRFLEEVYDTRSYRASVARRKAGAPGASQVDERASRKEYFQNSPQVRKAIRKAQAKHTARLL